MLEFLSTILPIIIYILLVILLVLLIIVVYRLLKTMKKVDLIVDNVDQKVNSLNGFFSVIDLATDKISLFSDRIIDTFTGIIQKVFRKKTKKEEENNNE